MLFNHFVGHPAERVPFYERNTRAAHGAARGNAQTEARASSKARPEAADEQPAIHHAITSLASRS
jgi:hypothetical protein